MKVSFNSRIFLSVLVCFVIFGFTSCKEKNMQDKTASTNSIEKEEPLFTLLPAATTNINYVNKLPKPTPSVNYFTYPNIYNGGGVSLGDLNNDGLPDIYFTSNFGHNKLYINKGNLKFEEISKKAGVEGAWGWTTGTSMIDINNDGYLDIYVCRAGNVPADKRRNELFINNGDLTFTEKAAEYNIDSESYSIQSAFLDFDKDGDLDMYLVNNPKILLLGDNFTNERKQRNPLTTDKFFRNDNGTFTEVSTKVGLVNNGIGFGHSISVGDFNNDTWPDMFVSNDYAEHDYLYFNNGDGTFSEKVKEGMRHISNFSMGTDTADFNNDGFLDLMVLDMVAEDNFRIKTNMSGMSVENFYNTVNLGLHHQYMTNTVHLNNGNETFSDVARLTGLSSTDWSWAPLWADFDLDGNQDLFVTNGYRKDVRNNDYGKVRDSILNEMARNNNENQFKYIEKVLNAMPEVPIKNYFFKNNGDISFSKKQEAWGITAETFSNGAAYADLDNDGDVDLVVNNIDQTASVYRNNAEKLTNKHFLKIKLNGPKSNLSGIGSRVVVKTDDNFQMKEHYLSKGYISSNEDILHFGMGDATTIDSLWVSWHDGNRQLLTNVETNQLLEISYKKENAPIASLFKKEPSMFADVTSNVSVPYRHKENKFNDFDHEILIPHKMSTMGPGMAVGDVNGDGLEDFYVGGAKGYTGEMYAQHNDGTFKKLRTTPWKLDAASEDMAAAFVDADGDGDLDLYVVSGGNEVAADSPLLQDRLYRNDGKGNFTKTTDVLPKMLASGGVIATSDYDADGDIDLFVGGRVVPGQYPKAARSYLLQNNGGTFKDVTQEIIPSLVNPGLVTTALWTDINNDKKPDLMVSGEWMPISVFENKGNSFVDSTKNLGLQDSNGWWYSIAEGDFDGDGDNDYIVGNLGQNYKYQASPTSTFDLYYDDFDNNNTGDIVLSYEEDGKKVPLRGRECSSQQMPFIKEKFGTYEAFAKAEMKDVFGEEKLKNALHLQAKTFASVYLQNNGSESWKIVPLPRMAQTSSINDVVVADITADGNLDVVLAGNLYGSEVETPRNDAGNGLVLIGNGKGEFATTSFVQSGFFAPHDAKQLKQINIGNKLHLVVVNNSEQLQFFELQ